MTMNLHAMLDDAQAMRRADRLLRSLALKHARNRTLAGFGLMERWPAAGAIAGALKADRLLLLTDVAGIKDETGAVVTQLTPDQVRDLTAKGVISGGMIPKTETALAALEQGVRAVVILDGRVPNACLLELFTDHGAGSLIRSTEPRVKPRTPRPMHRTKA